MVDKALMEHMLEEHSDIHEKVDAWFASGALAEDCVSIDLLPIFYGCYASMINPNLISIRLSKDGEEWFVQVFRDSSSAPKVSLSTLFNNDFKGISFYRAVHLVIDRSTEVEIALMLDIFNAAAKRLIVSCMETTEYEKEDIWQEQRKVSEFYLDCAMLLAEHIAEKIDLVPPTIAKLKSEPATGILDDCERSRWDEIVSDSREGDSLLLEGFTRDIRSTAYEAFGEWPRAKQLAFWLSYFSGSGCLDEIGETAIDGGAENFRLFDMDNILDEVVKEIRGIAIDEADERFES